MTFKEWWSQYPLPVINRTKQFDLLFAAARAAFNAGKRAGRKEESTKWLKRQSNLHASSGVRHSTGD